MELTTTNTTTDNSTQIKGALFAIEAVLEKFFTEIHRSSALIDIGEKTELVKSVEASISNPLKGLFNFSNEIDGQIKHVINGIVIKALKNNVDIIQAAYRTKSFLGDLHYSIVLIEDTHENRETVMDFLHDYSLLEVSEKMPVTFQFVPVELVDKIKTDGEISLR